MKGYGTMRANSHLASATMKGCHADADDIKEQYATTWRLSRALDQRHCYQEANSSFQWQASVPECRESLFQGNDPFKAHSPAMSRRDVLVRLSATAAIRWQWPLSLASYGCKDV
eukprot:scaffold160617_cov32-Tisochrysis_lutea.AAC.2